MSKKCLCTFSIFCTQSVVASLPVSPSCKESFWQARNDPVPAAKPPETLPVRGPAGPPTPPLEYWGQLYFPYRKEGPNLYYHPWQLTPTTSAIRSFGLQFTALQIAGFRAKQPSSRWICKYREKAFFHEILHCHLDFPFQMNIMDSTRRTLQGFLHTMK